jgi:hypothetical protein
MGDVAVRYQVRWSGDVLLIYYIGGFSITWIWAGSVVCSYEHFG